MGPGGQNWLPESVRQQVQDNANDDQGLYNNVLHPYIIHEDYNVKAVEHIASFAVRQIADAKVEWLREIETALMTEGHSNAMTVINDICANQKLLLIQLQALEAHEKAQASVGGDTARSKLASVRK